MMLSTKIVAHENGKMDDYQSCAANFVLNQSVKYYFIHIYCSAEMKI